MKNLFISLLTLLFLHSGFTQTTVNGSFIHNGILRDYSFYVPAAYNGTEAYPLVFNLHGYTSNAAQQSFYGDFKPIADTAHFIVVHPEGTIQTGTANTQFWNVGFFPSTVDDVSFLENLIDTISASYSINQNRIYSTGMSNGGYMSYNLACNSDRFAAIASVTGSMTTSMAANCNPTKPTPVMEIHGTLDPTVPYNGISGSLSIPSVLDYWVSFNNCPISPLITNVTNTSLTDGSTAEHYVYSAGNGGVTVEHFKVLNGAHTWPGSVLTIGVTCMDFSASKEIWRFFSQYEHPTAGLSSNNMWEQQFTLWPNPAIENIEFSTGEETDGFYSIYDLSGRILIKGEINNSITSISISALPEGIYTLSFQNKKGCLKKRFIKAN